MELRNHAVVVKAERDLENRPGAEMHQGAHVDQTRQEVFLAKLPTASFINTLGMYGNLKKPQKNWRWLLTLHFLDVNLGRGGKLGQTLEIDLKSA